MDRWDRHTALQGHDTGGSAGTQPQRRAGIRERLSLSPEDRDLPEGRGHRDCSPAMASPCLGVCSCLHPGGGTKPQQMPTPIPGSLCVRTMGRAAVGLGPQLTQQSLVAELCPLDGRHHCGKTILQVLPVSSENLQRRGSQRLHVSLQVLDHKNTQPR